ncbi:NAD-dependent epimerase/dehydratase family protein [Sporomusa sp. KB1]|jgi:UDP-glucose 4-epimerase|uniref:NAD-dependent epimerase/dehydratase family protein n=1 Tax=Sporomusa sp. KB1 TaxID=943346 RepID=UPI0011A65D49|nr:NAD-dependent epimerase/dehydratase family protein [Sporomusa sp. KB1]TWH48330.1 UDP-glucose 4-epimerase [Sporomusa sp. KB1]
MRVLVTGGAGFIGSHSVDKMIERGWEVVIIDNLSTGLRANVNARARLVEMDVLDNTLVELFSQEKFDCVLHLAAQTSVPYSIDHPDIDCQVNLLGLVNVMEACRKTGVKRVAVASSAAVYGDAASLPIVEETELKPGSFYGLTKCTKEKYLALYSQIYHIDYVALRYANVYGERQGDGGEGGVVSIFTRKIAADQTIGIFGDGGQTRDFIYVGDVAEANCQVLTAPLSAINRVYNVSTQTQTNVNDLAALLFQAAAKPAKMKYLPARNGDIYHSMLSNKAAVTSLGWKPVMPLADGLIRTYHWLKKKC